MNLSENGFFHSFPLTLKETSETFLMPSTRKLAAIMFTDIVGYTALMGEDEERAFQLLKKNRKVQKPIIEKHGGKWKKEMVDGYLRLDVIIYSI